ncbi:MAG: UDP-phosphomannose--protein mannosyltransferase [Rhodospirillales bacterium]|nr:UDP-phosphomannose--protein mannosyltransferase [Rhodospirillales bacterium]
MELRDVLHPGLAREVSATRWLALLGLATLARLALAATIPLAPDEAYYRIWAFSLQGGYLDHPPMVALFIRAGMALFGDTTLGIRALGPLGTGIASLMIWRATELLFPGRGAAAVLMLNATLLVGIGTVVMTPDTPLLFFWCAALWAMAELRASGNGWWWLAVGLAAGGALLSKYTGVLLGLGIVAWLLAERGAWRWWRDWRLYAAGVLALACFAPVIAWNAAHAWVSFVKQGGRAGAESGGPGLRFIGELLGGQVLLATPILFVLFVAGVVVALRKRAFFLAAFVLPGTAIFLWQATGSRVQGNWPAILYPAAAMLAAGYLGTAWQGWRRGGIALGLIMGLAAQIQALAAPVPLPRGRDPTLARLAGWPEFAATVQRAARATGADFVAAEEYGLASELAVHVGMPVVAMEGRWAYLQLPAPLPGVPGLLVRSLRRGEGAPNWPGATLVEGELVRSRRGIEAERYRLYRVLSGPGPAPQVVLPPP